MTDAEASLLAWSTQVDRFSSQLDARLGDGPDVADVDHWIELLRSRDQLESVRDELDRWSFRKVERTFESMTGVLPIDWLQFTRHTGPTSGAWWERVPLRGPVLQQLMDRGLECPTRPLSQVESMLIGQCLIAAATGPYFAESWFRGILNLDHKTLLQIAREWPSASLTPRIVKYVGSAVFNLLWYPHGQEERLLADIAIDARRDLRQLDLRWRWITDGATGDATVLPEHEHEPLWPGGPRHSAALAHLLKTQRLV